MALPETIRFQVTKLVGEYCEERVPPHISDQVKVVYEVSGNAVTIFETRPPWREEASLAWTKTKIAQMRWDPGAKLWSLWWADRNDRWLSYRDFDASPTLRDCLWQLDNDRTGAFWG